MKNKWFQKIQLCTSIVPFYSTILIAIITSFMLAKRKASFMVWLKYFLILAISVIVASIFISITKPIWPDAIVYILSACMLAIANVFLLKLQSETFLRKEKNVEISENIENENSPAPTKNNKIKFFVVIFCACVLLVTVLVLYMYFSFKSNIIHDTNGSDNFELNTITIEEIGDTVYSDYSGFFATSSNSGHTTQVEESRLQECDFDFTEHSFKSLNGVLIANATNTDSDCLRLEITSEVLSGNLEVFIYIEEELYSSVEINSTRAFELSNIKNKTVYVKAAGEEANVRIKVSREIQNTTQATQGDGSLVS